MDNLGYCCLNQTLRADKIYTDRKLIRRTFTMEKAADLALQNCKDLLTILKWNAKHNIKVFRITSNLFPRMTDPQQGYRFTELATHKECEKALNEAGKFAFDNQMILSSHPGPYTVLSSPRDSVVERSTQDIVCHYELGEMLKADAPDLQFHINFHIGTKFDQANGDRFCKSFDALPEKVKSAIIIENDDKASCWSILKLYDHIYSRVGTPLTFDYHHSKFSREPDIPVDYEFAIAKRTWIDRNCKQETHYSSSDNNTPKHSDYVLETIPDWMTKDDSIYIHLEVKAKELALIKYRESNRE